MRPRSEQWLAIFVCLLVSALWFALTSHWGFDLADEGFYWYGAQRLLTGELPLYDFTAYDIGRYAWAAGWMWLLNDTGVVTARWAAQAMLIPAWAYLVWRCVLALPAPRSALKCCVWTALVTLLLALWVRPYYKAADFVACVMVIAAMDLVITSPRGRHALGAGALVGLAAIIGRNHGLYAAVAALLCGVFLLLRGVPLAQLIRAAGLFIAGVLLGYSPNIVLMLAAPNYWYGFYLSILQLLELGSTNIGLPVPWPWRLAWRTDGVIYTVTQYLGESLMFLVVALAPIWALVFSVKVIRLKGEMTPSLAFTSACLITAVPYAHYAFSRADRTHLSLSVYPLLLAAIAMPIGYLLLRIAGLLIVTLFITVPDHPALSLSVMGRPSEAITVGSDVIQAPAHLAHRISSIENALNSLGTKSFVALPDMPGLHAMLNEPMRVRDIYVLFRRSEAYQREEVSRLAKNPPQLIFVSTRLLDGRQDLTFARLAPFIQGWIGEHYEQVRLPGMPQDLEIWKVRETVE